MEKSNWLILGLVMLAFSVASGEYIIRVDSNFGRNTLNCVNQSLSHQPCATLDYVGRTLPRYANNSVRVEIESDSLDLNEMAEFVDFSGLVLTANSSRSTILCARSSDTSNPGLKFVRIQELVIRNLIILNCGSVQESTTTNHTNSSTDITMAKMRSAVYILNTTGVELTNVSVCNSTGMGVSVFDTNGIVRFTNSNFSGSGFTVPGDDSCPSYPGGNGVYVEFSSCTPGVYGSCLHPHGRNKNSSYTFENCRFESNNATTVSCFYEKYNNPIKEDFHGLGRGGGLALTLRSDASNNSFRFSNCVFSRNWAAWGAGLSILLQDCPLLNHIVVEDSVFERNYCYHGAGGGGSVGYLFDPEPIEKRGNSVTFWNCDFRSNKAKMYAGGISIYASRGFHNAALSDTIDFTNCTFAKHKSLTAAAVDISPSAWKILGNSLLPIPVFTDCTFEFNTVEAQVTKVAEGVAQDLGGVGTFLVNSFKVRFQGTTTFSNNTGTALYLTSGVVEFSSNSLVIFESNEGENGGAISIIAFSVIYIHANSQIFFRNNKAEIKGGAIYVATVDQHYHLSSRSCFFQYRSASNEPNEKPDNIQVLFEGNQASDGNSIFATSLQPCVTACGQEHTITHLKDVFRCVGTFHFNDTAKGYNVTTLARNYSIQPNKEKRLPLTIVPGKTHSLPIHAYDELHQLKSNVVYRALLTKLSNCSIRIDPSYTYIPDNRIRLLGRPPGEGRLTLENSLYRASVTFNVSVVECPPGFRLDNTSEGMECVCADARYWGISECDTSRFRAFISHGFWYGYCDSEEKTKLCTSNCPIGFCSYESETGTMTEHELPARVSELDHYICGPTRTGTLCGKCSPGYSVYYPSFKYRCGPNHDCHIGWLYYLLSDILPVTVLFLAILVFDITFTTGATTGFILYSQVLDSLAIDANGVIQIPETVSTLYYIPKFMYRVLNLDPFSAFEKLSFCIWEGANVLNVMMMRYVTTGYALGLVLCTVFVMNTWKCRQLCMRFSYRTLKSTVIHGLTAFFILCYAQCTRVTILILNPSCLQGENIECVRRVVFRSGELPAFGSEHLKYAIPALLMLITFVTIPPLLLIAFPLSFKLLARCELSETRVVNWLSRIVPLQLLDSFQSCFQDNLRFFSGLYFFYRLFALIAYALSNTLIQFYLLVEIQVVLILAVHAIAQPYKKRWHNILDSLIFTDIAIINGLTIFNYQMATEAKEEPHHIERLIAISSTCQFVLISLPLVYMITYVVVMTTKRIKLWCAVQRKEEQVVNEGEGLSDHSIGLPSLRDHSGIHFDGHKYQKFNDSD